MRLEPKPSDTKLASNSPVVFDPFLIPFLFQIVYHRKQYDISIFWTPCIATSEIVLVRIQGVFLIVSPNTSSLLHRKSTFAKASSESCRALQNKFVFALSLLFVRNGPETFRLFSLKFWIV